jgi:hypothetical protein
MDGELELLGERIAEHAAHLDAAKHRLLTDLREFDQRGGWHVQGAMSCAHWLAWRVGWDLVTAREHVRVAGKLADFASLDDALRRGEVSYSKVRAMLRIATPENEPLLLGYAQLMTASQLEVTCRKYALVQRHGKESHPLDDQYRRYVRRRDTDDGMVKIEAVLHPEEAELVWTMLNHAATQRTRQPEASATPAGRADSAESNLAAPHTITRAPVPPATPEADVATPRHAAVPRDTATPRHAAVPRDTATLRQAAVPRDAAAPSKADAAQPTSDAAAATDTSPTMSGDSAESNLAAPHTTPRGPLPPATHVADIATPLHAATLRDAAAPSETDAAPSTSDAAVHRDAAPAAGASVGMYQDSMESRTTVRPAVPQSSPHVSVLDEGAAAKEHLAVMREMDRAPAASRETAHGFADLPGAPGARAPTAGLRDAAVRSMPEATVPQRGAGVLHQQVDAVKRAFNRADALVSLAQAYLRGDCPERSPIEITISIPAASLRAEIVDPVEVGEIGDALLSPDAVRRLSCDAGVVEVIEDEHGAPLSVGRKRRTIAGALMRALRKRDPVCTFPGCTNRLFLEGHHVKHWVDGGETSPLNITMLCTLHHRFVHEYGYRIEMGTDQRPRFRDPSGRLVTPVPAAQRVPELGWPSILALNEPLAIDANTIACGWDGRPVDHGAVISHLVAADRLC